MTAPPLQHYLDDDCDCRDWWQHRTGSRHCLRCWTCHFPDQTTATSAPQWFRAAYGLDVPKGADSE